MSSSKLSLKLLIDQTANRVVFAEAGKETIDFLFSILTLPVGTVVSLLSKQDMVGSLANLYGSVELNVDYIQPGQNKDILLKPNAYTSTEEITLFSLTNNAPKKRESEENPETVCPNCSSLMNRKVPLVGDIRDKTAVEGGRKVGGCRIIVGCRNNSSTKKQKLVYET